MPIDADGIRLAPGERSLGAGRAPGRILCAFISPRPPPGSRRPAKTIKAHITGNTWKIQVRVGDRIEEGTVVTILESMKMKMPVQAEEPGTITAVHVTEGQAIREGQVIAAYDQEGGQDLCECRPRAPSWEVSLPVQSGVSDDRRMHAPARRVCSRGHGVHVVCA